MIAYSDNSGAGFSGTGTTTSTGNDPWPEYDVTEAFIFPYYCGRQRPRDIPRPTLKEQRLAFRLWLRGSLHEWPVPRILWIRAFDDRHRVRLQSCRMTTRRDIKDVRGER